MQKANARRVQKRRHLMAVQRDNPYPNYNFLVDLGTGESESVQAGFTQVVLPEIQVEVMEYRSGNERGSASRKLPGRVSYGDLVLKRGVIGALDLYEWINQVRQGDVNARRNVRIQLQNEDRTATVLTWMFRNTFPVEFSFSELDAVEEDVLIETLILAVESMEIE
jgi:phage tail-like protein